MDFGAGAIRKVVGANHFAIHTGTEDLRTQMEMFARARLVVGAHGAGLSNLLFSDPGTRVVLFPMKPHVDHTFAHLVAALDQKLYVMPEINSNYYGHYGKLKSSLIKQVKTLVKNILAEDKAERHGASSSDRDSADL